jgi:hypothetical protein
VAHLEQLDQLYGPIPGRPTKPVVLVEDNGPIHVSKLARAAIAAGGIASLRRRRRIERQLGGEEGGPR